MSEEFDINSALAAISARYTPEQREEDARLNLEMREKFGNKLSPDSPEQIILRAQQQEQDILKQITLLLPLPESDVKQNRLYQALNRLSEVLAAQNRFSEAVSVCPEQKRKEMYQREAEKL